MARTGAFGRAGGLRWWTAAAWFGVWLGGLAAVAQDDGVPTLHAYTNLVQVPTLVLDKSLQPLPPIAERRFFVRFDGGRRFRATHVRLEGDDPISLAIVVDLRQQYPGWMNNLDAAVAALAPLSLTVRDHVSIYAADCSLVRSLNDAPADSAMLQRGVESVLQPWRLRVAERRKQDCKSPWNLWDTLRSVMREEGTSRGRRVILVVTDGGERGSKTSGSAVREEAQGSGAAIFGMIQGDDVFASYHSGNRSSTETFGALCDFSGGMVMVGTERNLAEGLKQFVSRLRGRYIVEFPRPYSTEAGTHVMDITVDKLDAVIRPAGVTVPVDDPAILNSPTTVPSDRSNAPVLGKPREWPQ